MTEDIYIDVNYLTESERDIILQVLSKDEELRKQEKRRISSLKSELDALKAQSASEEEISSARICARCREPLGLLFNSGSLCPRCQLRVCKSCRKVTSQSWLCVLCAKIREVRAESGAWFHEHERKKSDIPQLYGSALVRASLRRSKPLPSQLKNGKGPGSPPAITIDLDNHGKLHRPVPVHMSRLLEDDKEQEEKEGTQEINRNYKQYSKASPVSRKEQAEEQNDEQEKMSSSSDSSTPLGSPVGSQGAYSDAESPEDTVFDHLVPEISIEHEQREIEEDNEEGEYEEEADVAQRTDRSQDRDVVCGYSTEEHHEDENEMNDSIRTEKSHHQVHDDHSGHLPTVEITTNWQEVAYEWAARQTGSGQMEQDIQTTSDHLGPRPASPDSQTTGEFFTPLTSPLHSGTGTPALSDHEQMEEVGSGSEYVDAGDAMPVEGNGTVMSLPEEDVHNVTVTNADADVSDEGETQDGQMTPTADDDIDQAFMRYGKKNVGAVSGTKKLQDQLNLLNMGSRESIVSYYSDAGEGRFGNIPVTGEILFGLFYNKRKLELEVQVHRAKDIAPADEKKGKSDPYVKVYLLPDKTKGGKRKTKAKKNTLNPDFDEILKFKIGFDEMLTRTLWLAVWNHDTFGHNDFLGEVMLSLDTYQESGFSWSDPSPNWYPLRERRPEPSLMTYCGDMTVALKFQPSDESKKKKKKLAGKLHVKLKEARNLPAKDSNGFSDPFCKSYLLPDTSKKTKQKTPVVKKNLNPIWNYSFTYDNVTMEELMDRVLELTVWDYDRGSSNDFLGGLRLGLGAMTEPWDDSSGLEVEAWQAMLDWPNQWQEYTINLRSTMDSQVN